MSEVRGAQRYDEAGARLFDVCRPSVGFIEEGRGQVIRGGKHGDDKGGLPCCDQKLGEDNGEERMLPWRERWGLGKGRGSLAF